MSQVIDPRPEPTNLQLQDHVDIRFDAVIAVIGKISTGGAPAPGPTGPVHQLTDDPGATPFNQPPATTKMPPIAEMSEMMATRQKGWESQGYRQMLTLRSWLTNNLNNLEKNGSTWEPWYVGAQLQGLADAYTAQWIDTGTGVDVKAIITALVEQYGRWQASNQGGQK